MLRTKVPGKSSRRICIIDVCVCDVVRVHWTDPGCASLRILGSFHCDVGD